MSKTATILAVSAADITVDPDMGVTRIHPGFNPDLWAGPRPALEEMPQFRQIIPYIMVRNGDKFLAYVRSATGGEGRLHNKVSIGVGGHTDAEDAFYKDDGSFDFWATLDSAARRELSEELGIPAGVVHIGYNPFLTIGLIASNDGEVDKVHLGILMEWDVTKRVAQQGLFFKFEDALAETRWMTAHELRAAADKVELELESWTAKALEII